MISTTSEISTMMTVIEKHDSVMIFILILSIIGIVFGDDLLVETTLGKVQGHVNELGMKEWKGIR